MYVRNDVRHDSRVLREAASLAAASHHVTIIGTAGTDESNSREEHGGVTIIRVAVPQQTTWWVTYIRAPWRLIGLGVSSARRSFVAGPARWNHGLVVLAFLVISTPWILVRGAWFAFVNRTMGRPVTFGGLDYVKHWRAAILSWDRAAVAAAPFADVHHAHDMEALPAARMGSERDGTRFVYDSHEIFTEWGRLLEQPLWLRWVMARWERRMARQAAAVITINGSIAGELERRLSPRRLVVVHNCPPRWYPPAQPENRIRTAAGIAEDAPIVLCHGGFALHRGLEETAAALATPALRDAHLVFMGYRVHVIEPILNGAEHAGRVHYLPPVAPEEVPAWVSGADVDVMTILHVDLNSYLSTPNKLFESLAAGVPVITSDFPERHRIVLEDPAGPLGAVCDPTDPASIAKAISSILDLPDGARADLRRRCLTAAHERWNWETESVKLVELYGELARGSAPTMES